MSEYLWHYTGAKEAFLQKMDVRSWAVLGVRGNVLHRSSSKTEAVRWAKENGYRLSR